MANKYSRVSLRAMTDESLLIMLIQISRERFDPAVKEKPTHDEATSVIYEILCRLYKVETLYKKLEEKGCACPCPDHPTPDPPGPRGPLTRMLCLVV